ncbi:hypothetical protein HPB50_011003 [Hyalomma asiaticum]|uniref:Uncharacterized protein n=1 Tax=Hyalomma asiaticum TaxID=266040 RepID=A0ACB7TIZ9_HYAAI|nr:hypothetical protein HPB50_011003 [Hyalomma asiaticum]
MWRDACPKIAELRRCRRGPDARQLLPDRYADALNFKPKTGDIFLVNVSHVRNSLGTADSQLIINPWRCRASNYLDFQMKTPSLELHRHGNLDSMPPPALFQDALRLRPAGLTTKDAKRDGLRDYFDNLLSWYEHKDDANVCFLTYEDLKKNTRDGVLRLARFFGKEYAEPLEKDPDLLQQELLNAAEGSFMEPVRKLFVPRDGKDRMVQFIRKGEVGDWKCHFTPQQEARMQARIKEKTAGTDVMSLWKD